MKKTLYILLCLNSSTLYAESTSWGIELNPFRVLILGSDWESFSGTITHFDSEKGIAIAMPIFYSNENKRGQSKDREQNLNISF